MSGRPSGWRRQPEGRDCRVIQSASRGSHAVQTDAVIPALWPVVRPWPLTGRLRRRRLPARPPARAGPGHRPHACSALKLSWNLNAPRLPPAPQSASETVMITRPAGGIPWHCEWPRTRGPGPGLPRHSGARPSLAAAGRAGLGRPEPDSQAVSLPVPHRLHFEVGALLTAQSSPGHWQITGKFHSGWP